MSHERAAASPASPGADIIAVNTATGARKWITRADGHPDAQITGAAIIDRGVVYVGVSSSEETAANNPAYKCCTFRGSLVALGEATGKVLWKTYTVPVNGGKQGGYSGGAVWGSTPAIDQATDSVYVGTGNNYRVPAAAAACVANAMKQHPSDAKCTAPNDYYWGSGYTKSGTGSPSRRLYAFSVASGGSEAEE